MIKICDFCREDMAKDFNHLDECACACHVDLKEWSRKTQKKNKKGSTP